MRGPTIWFAGGAAALDVRGIQSDFETAVMQSLTDLVASGGRGGSFKKR